MKITELNYNLPASLIAQQPLKDRDKAKLLVLHRETGQIEHRLFFEITDYLNEGDFLIINNTKVIPARLIGRKPTGGKIEILLIKENKAEESRWEIMTKGDYEGIVFVDEIKCLIRKNSHGKELVFIDLDSHSAKNFILEKGLMPLPPYIKRKPVDEDRETYQTVYAQKNGSIAAPTAGLHFTEELLERISKKGAFIKAITLHVGVGTFKMIKSEEIEKHKMDSEYFEIERRLFEDILKAKAQGKRIFSVGTTTTRTLEGYASGKFEDTGSDESIVRGFTDIFIYPGYEFKIIDALITNFHLPKSTPLALVYAFCQSRHVKKAYEEAIEKKYRFFSYGDAMLII